MKYIQIKHRLMIVEVLLVVMSLITLLLVTAASVTAISAVSAIIEPTAPATVLPGSFFSLMVKITNTNAVSLEHMEVHIDVPSNLQIDTEERSIALLVPGQSVVLQWNVKVRSSAPSGYETFNIHLQSDTLNQEAEVPVLIKSIESSLELQQIETNPAQLEPGSAGEITIHLQNHASYSLRDIHLALELAPTAPIAPRNGTEERIIASLSAGETATLTYTISVLPKSEPGIYTLPLHLTYADQFGQLYTRTHTMTVEISAIPHLQISTEGKIVEGKQGDITLKVVNIGLTPIQFLTLHLQHSAVLSPSSIYMGSLDRDDFQTEQITLLANGPLQIPTTLEFRDGNNRPYTQQVSLPITVVNQETAKKLGLEKSSFWPYVLIPAVLLSIIYLVRKLFAKKKIKEKKQ